MFELMVEDSFSAAHQLLKSKTPCENLHGHNWRIQLFVRGRKLDKKVGWVMDFHLIKAALKKELAKYDHKILNEVLLLSPSAENIAQTIFKNLKNTLPVYKVSVWETEKACASYFADQEK